MKRELDVYDETNSTHSTDLVVGLPRHRASSNNLPRRRRGMNSFHFSQAQDWRGSSDVAQSWRAAALELCRCVRWRLDRALRRAMVPLFPLWSWRPGALASCECCDSSVCRSLDVTRSGMFPRSQHSTRKKRQRPNSSDLLRNKKRNTRR